MKLETKQQQLLLFFSFFSFSWTPLEYDNHSNAHLFIIVVQYYSYSSSLANYHGRWFNHSCGVRSWEKMYKVHMKEYKGKWNITCQLWQNNCPARKLGKKAEHEIIWVWIINSLKQYYKFFIPFDGTLHHSSYHEFVSTRHISLIHTYIHIYTYMNGAMEALPYQLVINVFHVFFWKFCIIDQLLFFDKRVSWFK